MKYYLFLTSGGRTGKKIVVLAQVSAPSFDKENLKRASKNLFPPHAALNDFVNERLIGLVSYLKYGW